MDEKLTMMNGTIIQHVQTIESLQGLWIHIREGLTLDQAYSLFSDPDNTERMESDRTDPAHPDGSTVFNGYTDLYMLKREDNGMMIVGLHEVQA